MINIYTWYCMVKRSWRGRVGNTSKGLVYRLNNPNLDRFCSRIGHWWYCTWSNVCPIFLCNAVWVMWNRSSQCTWILGTFYFLEKSTFVRQLWGILNEYVRSHNKIYFSIFLLIFFILEDFLLFYSLLCFADIFFFYIQR